jgi:hypothetical protein
LEDCFPGFYWNKIPEAKPWLNEDYTTTKCIEDNNDDSEENEFLQDCFANTNFINEPKPLSIQIFSVDEDTMTIVGSPSNSSKIDLKSETSNNGELSAKEESPFTPFTPNTLHELQKEIDNTNHKLQVVINNIEDWEMSQKDREEITKLIEEKIYFLDQNVKHLTSV